MAKLDWQKRLNGLMRLHVEGAYTDGEFIHATIMLFDGGDESLNGLLWLELQESIKEEILKLMQKIDDDSDLLAPAHCDDNGLMKAHYLSLKKWLIANNFFFN